MGRFETIARLNEMAAAFDCKVNAFGYILKLVYGATARSAGIWPYLTDCAKAFFG